MALPIALKAEFNFKLILYITIFLSKVQAAALNPQSVFKTHLNGVALQTCQNLCKFGKIDDVRVCLHVFNLNTSSMI